MNSNEHHQIPLQNSMQLMVKMEPNPFIYGLFQKIKRIPS